MQERKRFRAFHTAVVEFRKQWATANSLLVRECRAAVRCHQALMDMYTQGLTRNLGARQDTEPDVGGAANMRSRDGVDERKSSALDDAPTTTARPQSTTATSPASALVRHLGSARECVLELATVFGTLSSVQPPAGVSDARSAVLCMYQRALDTKRLVLHDLRAVLGKLPRVSEGRPTTSLTAAKRTVVVGGGHGDTVDGNSAGRRNERSGTGGGGRDGAVLDVYLSCLNLEPFVDERTVDVALSLNEARRPPG